MIVGLLHEDNTRVGLVIGRALNAELERQAAELGVGKSLLLRQALVEFLGRDMSADERQARLGDPTLGDPRTLGRRMSRPRPVRPSAPGRHVVLRVKRLTCDSFRSASRLFAGDMAEASITGPGTAEALRDALRDRTRPLVTRAGQVRAALLTIGASTQAMREMSPTERTGYLSLARAWAIDRIGAGDADNLAIAIERLGADDMPTVSMIVTPIVDGRLAGHELLSSDGSELHRDFVERVGSAFGLRAAISC